MIRKMLDKVEPLFKPGGRFEKLYPLYEANDTFLFTPGETTHGTTHVRDAIDLKRMMSMVIVALIPCIFMAMYNTGYQAQKILHAASAVELPATWWDGAWRYSIMDSLGIDYRADRGGFLSFGSIVPCTIHGLLFFLPVYLVTMIAGGICEVIFSVIRRHEINEGFLVTGMLFPLTLPANIPLWQVAIGIAFGVVFGKEVFGGTGRNFLNPALTARAFLYFAYAKDISGDAVWTAVDGFTGATGLGAVKVAPPGAKMDDLMANMDGNFGGQVIEGSYTWWDAFWGNLQGSMGETSVICALIGAVILIMARIGSWQIMLGTLIGLVGASTLFWLMPFTGATYNVEPWWHVVLGGYAFGAVFMATDPVSASMTTKGKWVYGILIGVATIIVRAMNGAFAEGVMLAILFANCCAPFIDWVVMQGNIKKRKLRTA